jgi:hypothetical protein
VKKLDRATQPFGRSDSLNGYAAVEYATSSRASDNCEWSRGDLSSRVLGVIEDALEKADRTVVAKYIGPRYPNRWMVILGVEALSKNPLFA